MLQTILGVEQFNHIQQIICTVNEWVKAIAITIPFQKYLRMIIKMLYNCAFWLNSFPHLKRVDATLSPWTIMTGQRIQYNKHCKVELGRKRTQKLNGTKNIWINRPNNSKKRAGWTLFFKSTHREKGMHKYMDQNIHSKQRNWCSTPAGNCVQITGGEIFTNAYGTILTDEDKETDCTETEPMP